MLLTLHEPETRSKTSEKRREKNSQQHIDWPRGRKEGGDDGVYAPRVIMDLVLCAANSAMWCASAWCIWIQGGVVHNHLESTIDGL